ncbi:coiled-coil domain-containing protein 88B [Engraulis encrasicolus]|uniref:coiled-coil domain-containing protein 88B n=1 Tax=Engraulis encrasicolus TaxID=184585 RepID=UPI002FD5924D
MADTELMESLDTLLVQLALQTRELCSKKDDVHRQIKVFQTNIQQKKTCIEETRKSIEKLEDQILEKQKTVQHYRENTKGMKRTNDLMTHYEKVLESELERRNENCNRDMKMYQERIESCKAVLKKHKEKYHEHPLAQKLLLILAKNEEIEKRIRACEDQIAAGEKKRQELHDAARNKTLPEQGDDSVSVGHIELQMMEQGEASVEGKELLSQGQGSGWEVLDEGQGWGEERMEEADAGRGRAVQREVADKPKQGQREQEASFNVFGMAEGPAREEGFALGMAAEAAAAPTTTATIESRGQQQDPPTPKTPKAPSNPPRTPTTPQTPCTSTAAAGDADMQVPAAGAAGDVTPPPQQTPPRMKAALSTPTFKLGGRSDSTEEKSPGFVFTMPAEPTPAGFSAEPPQAGFSGFGFDMGSTAQEEEETPFSFTSEYFSDKKFSESKFSGFPFDQQESGSEDGFQFPFSSESPTQKPNSSEGGFQFSFSNQSPEQRPSSKDSAGSGDGFPFSFNF